MCGDLDDLVGLERLIAGAPIFNPPLQVGALDVLHHHIMATFVLAKIVDGDDVGMVQRSRGLSLTAEAPGQCRIDLDMVADELDRDIAIHLELTAHIDSGHTALTNFLHNAVAAQILANE